ncbi:hypothetical protein ALT721_800068 [Alteromonas alvinellae]
MHNEEVDVSTDQPVILTDEEQNLIVTSGLGVNVTEPEQVIEITQSGMLSFYETGASGDGYMSDQRPDTTSFGGLASERSFVRTLISWIETNVPNRHKLTRIFRATVDDFEQAVCVGDSQTQTFTDVVEPGIDYFYWLVGETYAGKQTVPSESIGVVATEDSNFLLDLLGLKSLVEDLSTLEDKLNQSYIGAYLNLEELAAQNLASNISLINESIATVTSNMVQIEQRLGLQSDTALALLEEQLTIMVDDSNAMIERVNTLTAKVNTESEERLAEIQRLELAQVTADSALAQTRDELTAKIDNETSLREASVVAERTARVNAYEVVASSVESLNTTFQTELSITNAAIDSERIARTTANAATAQQITDISTGFDTARAELDSRITQELTSQTTATEAVASALTELETQVTTDLARVESNVTEELTSYSSELESVAGQMLTLEANFQGLSGTLSQTNALITEESTTRANEYEALAQRTTQLEADFNSIDDSEVRALITTEETARANEDEALSSRITELDTKYTGKDSTTNARITDEVKTLSDANQALSTRTSTLEANYEELDNAAIRALVETETTARTTKDQALAKDISDLTTQMDTDIGTAKAEANEYTLSVVGYCTIDGAISDDTTKESCELNGGTWSQLPLSEAMDKVSVTITKPDGTVVTGNAGTFFQALTDDVGNVSTRAFLGTDVDGRITGIVATDASGDQTQSNLDLLGSKVNILNDATLQPFISFDTVNKRGVIRGQLILDDGTSVATEDDIRAHDGDTIYTDYQYSVNGTSNWHSPMANGDVFRRERIVTNGVGGTWSSASRLKGQDATPKYNWVKYSPNADGSNMTDIPNADTKYWGIAYNKSTATESTNKADYVWALMKGKDGDTPIKGEDYFDGKPGLDGNFISFIYNTTLSNRPNTPNSSAGTFDGTTETFPTGWSDDPVYEEGKITWFSKRTYTQNTDGSWTGSAWSLPTKWYEKGDKGDTPTITTNADGSYTISNGTDTVTIKDGDNAPIPTVTNNNNGTYTIDDGSGNTITVKDGDSPVKGVDYFDGLNGDFVSLVYKTSKNQPAKPSGGSFNGTTEVIPTGYSDTPTSYTAPNKRWVSTARYRHNGSSWSRVSGWSTPVIHAEKGPEGKTGLTGPGNYTIVNSSGTFPADATAISDFKSTFNQDPKKHDHLTYVNADNTESEVKRFDGTSWVAPTLVVNGDILTKGTVTTDALVTKAVTADKIDVGDLFSENITVTGSVKAISGNNQVVMSGSKNLLNATVGGKTLFNVSDSGEGVVNGRWLTPASIYKNSLSQEVIDFIIGQVGNLAAATGGVRSYEINPISQINYALGSIPHGTNPVRVSLSGSASDTVSGSSAPAAPSVTAKILRNGTLIKTYNLEGTVEDFSEQGFTQYVRTLNFNYSFEDTNAPDDTELTYTVNFSSMSSDFPSDSEASFSISEDGSGGASFGWGSVTGKPQTATRWPSFSEVSGSLNKNLTFGGVSDADGYFIGRKNGTGGTTVSSLTDVYIEADQNGNGASQSVRIKAGQSGKELRVTSGTASFGGQYVSEGHIISGSGRGGAALTINDGQGNANLTFNHVNGVPEINGNSGRIEFNKDGTSNAGFSFEVKSGVTAGQAVGLNQVMFLSESTFTYKNQKVYHEGNKPTLGELGAAAASHNHSAANITSGTLNSARLPTITYSMVNFANQNLNTSSSPNFAGLTISNNEVYHAGNKPTPSEIGAAAASHSHSNYVVKSSNATLNQLNISDYIDLPSKGAGKYHLLRTEGSGGIWQVSDRGGLMFTSADDSLVLANGDVGRGFAADASNGIDPNAEYIYLLSDGNIVFKTGLQEGFGTEHTFEMTNSGLLRVNGNTVYDRGDKVVEYGATDVSQINDPNFATSIRDLSSSVSSEVGLPSGWHHIINMAHQNSNGYGGQIAMSFGNNPQLRIRGAAGMSFGGWSNVYHENHKPTYSELGTINPSHTSFANQNLNTSSIPTFDGLNLDSSTHANLNIDRGSTAYDANIMFRTAGSVKWRLWMGNGDNKIGIRHESSGHEPLRIYENNVAVKQKLNLANTSNGDLDGYYIGRKDGSGGTEISSWTDVYIRADTNASSDSNQYVRISATNGGDEFQVRRNETYFTGSHVTTSQVVAGQGSGSVSLTVNDGYGNANIAFNHRGGIPDAPGNSGRIVVNTDSNGGANMAFSLGSNSVAGEAIGLNTPLLLDENNILLNGKKAFEFRDSWLRINEYNSFSSGIYCGLSRLRTDGVLEVGNAGQYFLADSNRVNITPRLNVADNVRFHNINQGIWFNPDGYNDQGGIRFRGSNGNDGYMEFWTNDDYQEPFVFRMYDSGNTGANRTPLRIDSDKLTVNGEILLTDDSGLVVRTSTNNIGAKITFSDNSSTNYQQRGFITYRHGNGAFGYASDDAFEISGSEANTLLVVRGVTWAEDFVATSDRRVKEDLKNIGSALDKVNELQGYTYIQTQLKERKAGIIAQDVRRVLPEAVGETNDGMLNVSPMALIGLLVNAVNELSGQVKELQNGNV